MVFLRRIGFGVATAIALAAVIIVSGAGASQAGEDPELPFWEGTYAGENSAGLDTVVRLRVDEASRTAGIGFVGTADLYMEVLGQPCDEILTLKLTGMTVEDDFELDFSGSGENGGVGGEFFFVDEGEPPIQSNGIIPLVAGSGSVFKAEGEMSCSGGAQFELEQAFLFGDSDCSFQKIFDNGSGSASPSGADPDPFDGIAAVDALNTLKFVAGIPLGATPAGALDETCPPFGSELLNGLIVGDVDCDGDVDAVDALFILRFIAALPLPGVPEGCPTVGAFTPLG